MKLTIKIYCPIAVMSDIVTNYTLSDHEYVYTRSILTITKFTSFSNAISFLDCMKSDIHDKNMTLVSVTMINEANKN